MAIPPCREEQNQLDDQTPCFAQVNGLIQESSRGTTSSRSCQTVVAASREQRAERNATARQRSERMRERRRCDNVLGARAGRVVVDGSRRRAARPAPRTTSTPAHGARAQRLRPAEGRRRRTSTTSTAIGQFITSHSPDVAANGAAICFARNTSVPTCVARDAERRGDVVVGRLAVVREHERNTIAFRQRRYRGVDLCARSSVKRSRKMFVSLASAAMRSSDSVPNSVFSLARRRKQSMQ